MRPNHVPITDPDFKLMRAAYHDGDLIATRLYQHMPVFAERAGFRPYVDLPSIESVRHWLAEDYDPSEAMARWMTAAWRDMTKQA